jgi:hypothetical protein
MSEPSGKAIETLFRDTPISSLPGLRTISEETSLDSEEAFMEKAVEYRRLAARFRREAALATLETARQLKLAAAQRWDELAAEIEMVVAPSVERDDGWIY